MIRRIYNRLIASSALVFIVITSGVLFCIALAIWLLTFPFDRRLVLLHRFTCLWASLYLWAFPAWSVSIQGREKIDEAKTYVMVSNHLSLVDILIVFRLFVHFKWVSKSEIFRVPLIGWNMLLNRYVALVRGNKESIVKMYDKCAHHLQQGSSIFIFPEGTRSTTGEMRDFKEGAFVLAKENHVPLLLFAISGSRDALPKHSLNFHGTHHMTIRVLGEIPYAEFAATPVKDLACEVRGRIAEQVASEPVVQEA